MLHVKQFVFNMLEVNSYLLWDDASHQALLIDCAAQYKSEEEELDAFLREKGLTLVAALQTHMHFDHIFGIPALERAYGVLPRFHKGDSELYQRLPEWLAMMEIRQTVAFPALTQYVSDNEVIDFSGTPLHVLHTPGHSQGCVCYYLPTEGILFSGDTLFAGSMGRADLPGGDYEQEVMSIRNRLFALPDDVRVFPGHGPATTIGRERSTFIG